MSDLQDRCPKGCAATKTGDVSSQILIGCCHFNKKSAFSCWSDESFQAWGSWWQRKAGVLLPRGVLMGWMKWEEMDLAYRISLNPAAAGSTWPRVECGDYGKYFYIVTFHFMNCGVWDTWRTLLCWQDLSHFNWVALAPSHLIPSPFPLLQELLDLCVSAGPPLAEAPL